jgi:hypothetical protein
MIINAFRLANLAASSCKNIHVNVLALCAARKDPTDRARGERETSAEDTKADGPRLSGRHLIDRRGARALMAADLCRAKNITLIRAEVFNAASLK